MTSSSSIRRYADTEAARFPPLLARADQLSGSLLLGEHGRRRAGMGDDFWQYRPLQSGDNHRMVDWRRSARSDAQFVREREWKTAQNVLLWVDQSTSMQFSSNPKHPGKSDRARLLALAASILLIKGGERVGLTDATLPPRKGNAQITRMAEFLSKNHTADYLPPEMHNVPPHARALFCSDFMTDLTPVTSALTAAADKGVRGILLQILDPAEEAFPYKGRTVFKSISGALRHETLKADDLRHRYLDRLAARKAELAALCVSVGWRYHCHHTNQTAQSALLWLYRALDDTA